MKCKYCKNKISFTDWLAFSFSCYPCYDRIEDIRREKQSEKSQNHWENSNNYWNKK